MKQKQQIIHIGGGEAFNSYEQYIRYLQTAPLWHMQSDYIPSWSKRYEEYLDENYYTCLKIPMPSDGNAKYIEWKIWFERHFEFFNSELILVGHSLGGIFLAKYFSENHFPFTIKQLHFVAPVFDHEDDVEQLADFKLLNFPGKLLHQTVGEIHIYHSQDDAVVPVGESEKYHQLLPGSQLHIFKDRGHFLDETFPELFHCIQESI